MAFSSTVERSENIGSLRLKMGTYTNANIGDTGGSITTGLNKIWMQCVTPTSDWQTSSPKVTVSGGTLTILCADQTDGVWAVIGL